MNPPRHVARPSALPLLHLLLAMVGLTLPIAACDPPPAASPPSVLIVAPPLLDPAEHLAQADATAILTRDLAAMGQSSELLLTDNPDHLQRSINASSSIALVVVLDADRLGTPDPLAADASPLPDPRFDDRFALLTSSPSTAPLRVDLFAHTRLGRFYAVYELLRRLGARYFHPEDPFFPELPTPLLAARAQGPTALGPGPVYAPDFGHRAFTFHAPHPLEHLEAFSDARHPIAEATRVNDWIIANRGDIARGAGRGIAPPAAAAQRAAELETLRRRRGLRASTGITLHNQQQGASADLDPTSPTPIPDQIAAAVDRALTAVPDAYRFTVHFGPTELTTTPDRETVSWLNLAGRAAGARGLSVDVNDHTTGSQPVDHYDDLGCPPGTNGRAVVDYYDLAFHTDPALGVRVHTVMFYPLEGPAPVYGQKSFAHKLCLMRRASAAGRPLTYFPESAYWLSWDNAVPVYLPLYLWARARDFALIRPLLVKHGGTLRDHRLFNSGHEWGYWQTDYAVGLWHWDSAIPLDAVLGELGDPLCAPTSWGTCSARATFIAVLNDVIALQREAFLDAKDFRDRPGGLYLYFAGEDPADEIGAQSGLEFRPLRLPFRDVATLSPFAAAALAAEDLAALDRIALALEGQHARLMAVRPDVPHQGARYLDEVLDGLAIDALRARHTVALYRTALALRDHPPEHSAVTTPLGAARAALAAAGRVIARREAAYRYPALQLFGGGLTQATAVPNGTTYPYRVHTKTHLLTYWTHRQEQVEHLVLGAAPRSDALVLRPVFAAPDVPVAVTWPDFADLSGALDRGDGGALAVATGSFSYAAPGIYQIHGSLYSSGESITYQGAIIRSSQRAVVPSGGFELTDPPDDLARTVLNALLPPFQIALSAAHLALLPEPSGAIGQASFADVTVAGLEEASASGFRSQPFAFALPIPNPASGEVAVEVRVREAIVSGINSDIANMALENESITLEGALSVDDLVAALVALAGFEPAGATATLAGMLGFDAQDPPEFVPFSAFLTLNAPEDPP